jgi:L-lactate dehydrogenase complex protein LldE
MTARESLLQLLLGSFTGIVVSQLQRKDECCGFGGTFAVGEEAVSAMMGEDRINDHLQAGTEVLTAGDMSCLMHLDGIIRRWAPPIRAPHYAQIMAQAMQQAPDARQNAPQQLVSTKQTRTHLNKHQTSQNFQDFTVTFRMAGRHGTSSTRR